MFNKLTYRQRLKWIGALAMLALIICYKLAISKTVDEYNNYSKAIKESNYLNQPDNSLAELLSREQKIDALFAQFQLDSLRADKNLLAVASNYCEENGLKLKEYKPYHLSKTDSIEVLTRILTVEGNFIPCTKLLYELEKSGKTGRISSVDYKSYTDPQDKKIKLNCSIYIQNIISNNHENN